MSSANPFKLDQSKILSFGKGYPVLRTHSFKATGFFTLFDTVFSGNCMGHRHLKSVPDDNILDWFKLKQIGDDI